MGGLFISNGGVSKSPFFTIFGSGVGVGVGATDTVSNTVSASILPRPISINCKVVVSLSAVNVNW